MNIQPAPLVVFCSFPDQTVARQIGTLLLEKQLAACVSFIEQTQSIYRWQGQIESATEVLATIKTSSVHFDLLEKTIRQHHPYEVPEIIGIPIIEISPAYRKWLNAELCDL
jgi:periplasmic divalent cation tolerance protein